jgi:hypothetical protein
VALRVYTSTTHVGPANVFVSSSFTVIRSHGNTLILSALEEKEQEDPSKAASAASRLKRIQQDFGKSKLGDVSNSTNRLGPTTPAAELDSLRTAISKNMWTISYATRRSSKSSGVDKGMGTGTLQFTGDTIMLGESSPVGCGFWWWTLIFYYPDVLAGLIEQLSVQWTSHGHIYDLSPSV